MLEADILSILLKFNEINELQPSNIDSILIIEEIPKLEIFILTIFFK